ncbi:MAG: hypothetical protein NT082_07180 [Chloroflexi bacterium]|nr:hypothetical protein [Chloroflexota bacterium]
MWRIMKFVLPALLVTAILVAGLAAVAYADTGQNGVKPQIGGKLLDRVAQILNIDKQKLTDAFKQAGTEIRQQTMDDRFSKWVAAGKITQDQADQYKAWLASRPGAALVGPKVADKLLQNGKITQAQYDAFKAWWDKKPNIELPKPEKPLNVPLRQAPGNVN